MNEPRPDAPAPRGPGRLTRASAWLRRRRDTLLLSAVRGAAYGAGAGTVGLVFWWIRRGA
ncbi:MULTISPECIES: hypothetical protein [Streptomyces]|uniref:Uncharacterized protein n=3 Tax=Streptomyces griseoaurantiacus TaxID=68213 RepID=F3NT18_9ACTN|nr:MULTISPECIES: hypothetical protein [Streptomyces]EGG43371.1 hypothetical protein SGM_6511 [Streptomyces griseoaurantiacus M045]MBA5221774.1 hypothetical protein [Streptomyces griseoaurantiacus]MCF0087947.1 hypothetical protein [Streptomyces sp. MH192]MCF0100344.1 hypothetical protein [Streptomyces sp. MH191]MDX3092212.1 hypothetical protein [Streptomyces sp. ME12-02E]